MLTKFMRVAIFVIVFFRCSEGTEHINIVPCRNDAEVIEAAKYNNETKGIVVIMFTNEPDNPVHIEALSYFETLGVKKGIIAVIGHGANSCTRTFNYLRTNKSHPSYPLFFVMRGCRVIEGFATGDKKDKLSNLWALAGTKHPRYRFNINDGTLSEAIQNKISEKNASNIEVKQARHEMKVQNNIDEYERAAIRNQRGIGIGNKPAEIQESGHKRSASDYGVPLMAETSTKRRPTMGALSSDHGREPEVYWPIAYNAYPGYPPIDWTKIQFPGGEGSSRYAQQESPKQGSSQQGSPSEGSPPTKYHNFF